METEGTRHKGLQKNTVRGGIVSAKIWGILVSNVCEDVQLQAKPYMYNRLRIKGLTLVYLEGDSLCVYVCMFVATLNLSPLMMISWDMN